MCVVGGLDFRGGSVERICFFVEEFMYFLLNVIDVEYVIKYVGLEC